MKLSKELKDHLEALDIRIYTTTSSRIIIGECLEVMDNGIEVGKPLLMTNASFFGEEVSYMKELIQENDSNSAVIFNSVIETESFASLALKKKYVDSLLEIKILDLLSGDLEELEGSKDESTGYSFIEDFESDNPKKDIDIEDSHFNDRWKGYMN